VPESELVEGYDVLAKPFSIETLLADVGAMLAQTTSVS
jgi:DNA-binding response OmpR family regulator